MFSKNLPIVFLIIVFLLFYKVCATLQNISNAQPNIEVFANEADDKRAILIDKADDYLGKKYRYAGHHPKSGFDCSGYTYFLMKELDISIPRSSAAQSKVGKKVPLKKAKAGDLVFFKKGKNNRIFHVAMIYSNENEDLQIIHSTSSRGVVIDELYSNKYWNPKVSHVVDVLAMNRP